MDSVYVYMFEMLDPVTGVWTRSQRLATSAAIARLGARPVPESGRLVFAEVIGGNGFVSPSYTM